MLSSLTGNTYRNFKRGGGDAFLKDIQKIVKDGTLKYVGKSTLKKGQDAIHIYRGSGATLILKNSNEFVTILKSGGGMDLGIKLLK